MIPSGKCPKCEAVVVQPVVKLADPNTLLSDISIRVMLIQCPSCSTILGASADVNVVAAAVERRLKGPSGLATRRA